MCSSDLHESTISQFKSKHSDLIEHYANEYLKAIPDIVNQDIEELRASTEISRDLRRLLQEESQIIEDKDGKPVELFQTQRITALQKYLDYTGKTRLDIKKSMGMSIAHAPAMVFQSLNIYNDNRQVISNTVLSALTNGAGSSTELPDDVVIDVDNVDK